MDIRKVRWANVWPCITQGWNSCCLRPASSLILSVSNIALQLQLQQANTGVLPREVCLSEGPQRVRKESPVTAERGSCSRQDEYYPGSGAGAAHVSLFWQGFFKCLQNLKARTMQQRPTLQYINQIFLGWLIASVFCWWIFFNFSFLP